MTTSTTTTDLQKLLEAHRANMKRMQEVYDVGRRLSHEDEMEIHLTLDKLRSAAAFALPALLALIHDARHIFETCNVQNHICSCGADMDAHNPMSSDHTPRDSGEYAVTKWMERFHANLSGAKP
jgi:hypothetical protein